MDQLKHTCGLFTISGSLAKRAVWKRTAPNKQNQDCMWSGPKQVNYTRSVFWRSLLFNADECLSCCFPHNDSALSSSRNGQNTINMMVNVVHLCAISLSQSDERISSLILHVMIILHGADWPQPGLYGFCPRVRWAVIVDVIRLWEECV